MPSNAWHRAIVDILRNTAGNVTIISAAGLVPLIGMLGGAMEASRGYLVKTRLQQACDAAVLGGRKAMGASAWTDNTRATADSFFRSNFPTNKYGTSESAIKYKVGTDQIVHADANATLPTTLMQLFGVKTMSMAASCDAKLELPNADIMFVLDTTLSMTEKNPGDSITRIDALRGSVQSFYKTLEDAKGGGTKVRYGFVPYSSTVNVGMLLKRDWLADEWTYQSRSPDGTDYTTETTSGTTTTYTAWRYVSGSKSETSYTVPPENCTAPTTDATHRVTNGPKVNGSWTQTGVYRGTQYYATMANNVCTIRRIIYNEYTEERTATEKDNPNAGQTTQRLRYWWRYRPIKYDLREMKNTDGNGIIKGGSITAEVGAQHQTRTISWNQSNGCIEERATTPGADPEKADLRSDLDVDGIPVAGQPATQWRPSLPGLVFARKQESYANPAPNYWSVPELRTSASYINLSDYTATRAACPTYSRKLAEIGSGTLASYMKELKPAGLTYHDVGMLWGLRLLSAQGLFAAENQPSQGGMVARHLLFMTDGQTETNIADYDAYGLSALDRRRSSGLPTASDQNQLVERRLRGLCNVAKAKGITVWVIAFGTELSSLLSDCASTGHAFQANNAAELDFTFGEIASNISQLRIVR